MTPERRVEIPRNADAERWGRTKETQPKATPPRKAAAPGETPPDLCRTWFLSLNDRGPYWWISMRRLTVKNVWIAVVYNGHQLPSALPRSIQVRDEAGEIVLFDSLIFPNHLLASLLLGLGHPCSSTHRSTASAGIALCCRLAHALDQRPGFLAPLAGLPTTAVAAAPKSVVFLWPTSAVLAIKARGDRLLAIINQAIPMPIKTTGIGFCELPARLRRNSAGGPCEPGVIRKRNASNVSASCARVSAASRSSCSV